MPSIATLPVVFLRVTVEFGCTVTLKLVLIPLVALLYKAVPLHSMIIFILILRLLVLAAPVVEASKFLRILVQLKLPVPLMFTNGPSIPKQMLSSILGFLLPIIPLQVMLPNT